LNYRAILLTGLFYPLNCRADLRRYISFPCRKITKSNHTYFIGLVDKNQANSKGSKPEKKTVF